MAKILLISLGSRGDMEPFLALGEELLQKGDEVEIVSYISNSTFQKTLTVKKGNKKLIVKGHGSLKPLKTIYIYV